MRQRSEALRKLGCTYLQLDDTSLAYLNDPSQREYITRLGSGGGDRQHLIIHPGVQCGSGEETQRDDGLRTYVRGNFRSSWVASGGYDYVR